MGKYRYSVSSVLFPHRGVMCSGRSTDGGDGDLTLELDGQGEAQDTVKTDSLANAPSRCRAFSTAPCAPVTFSVPTRSSLLSPALTCYLSLPYIRVL